jgi:hypothetical protein
VTHCRSSFLFCVAGHLVSAPQLLHTNQSSKHCGPDCVWSEPHLGTPLGLQLPAGFLPAAAASAFLPRANHKFDMSRTPFGKQRCAMSHKAVKAWGHSRIQWQRWYRLFGLLILFSFSFRLPQKLFFRCDWFRFHAGGDCFGRLWPLPPAETEWCKWA